MRVLFSASLDEVSADKIGKFGSEAPHRDRGSPAIDDSGRQRRHDDLQWLSVENEQKISPLEQEVVRFRSQAKDLCLLQRQKFQKT